MKASWNIDSYDKYLKPVFAKFPEWEQSILSDFITYKSGFVIPKFFGKDDVYTRPESIVPSFLYHIHLAVGTTFKSGTYQQNKTSNAALVYTQHKLITSTYSLLAIFPNNAHDFAKNNVIMNELASYANTFHKNPNP